MKIRAAFFALFVTLPIVKAQTPVIRAEAREVLIDVTVAGKNGASPGDLTAKDFSVWEDGKPQKITGITTASSDPGTAQKHFVIYFDFGAMRLEDQAESKKRAAEFVEAMSSPDRYMAVVVLTAGGARVTQDFTNAKAALIRAVAAPLNNQTQARNFPGNPSASTGPLPDSLSRVCESIAPATGRKAVLLFTGTSTSNYDAFGLTKVACNRANVAIHAIAGSVPVNSTAADLSRSRPGGPGALGMGADAQPIGNLAAFLAENTGGQVLALTETLPGQLAATAREQDDYYRIAYAPPPANDGSCHRLRVATSGRGLVTRARNEYCTEKQVDLVAGRIAGQSLESRAAASDGSSVKDGSVAAMQLPYFYTGTNRASVHLVVDATLAAMKFDKDKTGLHGQIDIVGTALRADGATASRFADTVTIDQPDQARADAFTHAPWRYEHQFTMAAGTYTFQLAIGAGASVAKLEVPLTIEPWNAATFGISGIAMSRESRALDIASSSGGPMLEGRGPLVAGDRQFIPVAANRFQRTEPIFFYTEIHDPGLASANSSPPAAQYRILDAKTGAPRLESGAANTGALVQPGNPKIPFAARLAVTDLPAGTYRLEVRAANASQQSAATRTLDFELY